MKITDITKQKNNSERVNIFLDNEYAFSLEEVDVLKFKLKIGMSLDEKEIEKLSLESNLSKAMKKAMDMLSRKPVTKKELENKLKDKGYDESVISVAVQELTELGYLNDYDYATLYLDYATEKCYGKKKIVYELTHKGVDPDIIYDVLDSHYKPTAEELSDMIFSKYGSVDCSDLKTKQRIMRFFVSRGFGFDEANDAIKHYENMQND